MTSNLSAIDYIQERSEATPGLFNRFLSTISANIAAIDSNATINLSGATLSIGSSVSIGRDLWVQGSITVGTEPSVATRTAVNIGVRSDTSDYLYFTDSSALRSNYILGSHVGGTADGLNLWDQSGSTMIVSFSKQSIRFFQNVVGPVFDVGGALASTLNAATFGTGADSTTSRIQAAISAASNAGIQRVYVPANMFPYNAAVMSFDTRVQMVREGGAWDVYDVQAYGAKSDPGFTTPVTWSTTAIQAAIHGANGSGGGIVYVPTGIYAISSLTLSRRITLRGSGGGRYLDATNVALLYQPSATTTVIFLADQGGSGAIIEDLQIGAAAATNQGGIRIAGMEFCQIRSVRLSGTSGFAIQIEGGNDTNMNTIQDCAITMTSVGTAIDVEGGPSGMDASPYMIGCFINTQSPTAWISIKSTTSGVAPDSALFTNNRFVESTSTITAIYGQMTNSRFIGNRFENVLGGLNVTLSPPNQVAAEFLGNSWAMTGGILNWIDNGTIPSTRFQEITTQGILNTVSGTALVPSYSFGSESSLGWYRSAKSAVGLSYGQLEIPAGTALAPSLAFSSESSLGVFRSGASSLALSYGSLRMPTGSELLFADTLPMRLWETGGTGFISVNRTLASARDNGSNAAWLIQISGNAGATDSWQAIHTTPGGSSAFAFSLDSLGDLTVGSGTAPNPAYGYISEASLGIFRSGASIVKMSYGQLSVDSGSNTTPGLGFSNTSLGLYRGGLQTISQSTGTFDLATNSVRLSVRTAASLDSTNLAVNEMAFTFIQSGASLGIRSGGTIWYFTSSASTKG